MANFLPAYNKTRVYEGGYNNDPDDRGAETYAGITMAYSADWDGWAILKKYKPLKREQIVNDPELEKSIYRFYQNEVWVKKVHGDAIKDQRVAEFIYDYTVHSGRRGVKAAQKYLGFVGKDLDGKMGPKTMTAINASDPVKLFNYMKTERTNFLIALSKEPGQQKFLNGWLNRVQSFN